SRDDFTYARRGTNPELPFTRVRERGGDDLGGRVSPFGFFRHLGVDEVDALTVALVFGEREAAIDARSDRPSPGASRHPLPAARGEGPLRGIRSSHSRAGNPRRGSGSRAASSPGKG